MNDRLADLVVINFDACVMLVGSACLEVVGHGFVTQWPAESMVEYFQFIIEWSAIYA